MAWINVNEKANVPQSQFTEELLKNTEPTLLHSETDNPNKSFSFSVQGSTLRCLLAFLTLRHGALKPSEGENEAKREKANMASPCFTSKRLGTNSIDLINGSNKTI